MVTKVNGASVVGKRLFRCHPERSEGAMTKGMPPSPSLHSGSG